MKARRSKPGTVKAVDGDYKDWPNAAGFNALDDHRTPIQLEVIGSIPPYVSGTLYRTGPGGYKISGDKDYAVSHWFDGLTVVHKFDIKQSDTTTVTYASYNQVDELIEHVRKTGRREEITFGQKRDPCDGLFKKVKTVFTSDSPMSAHAANIGVTFRESMPAELKDLGTRKIMSITTDTDKAKTFDADTLEPLGVTSQSILHPSLTGPLSGAHAVRDHNGDIFNYNLELGAKATYRIFKASPSTGNVEILATVSGSDIQGAYLHSILLSENFVIVCIWPAHYKMSGLSILWNRNILDAMKFDPNAKAVWLVIDRRHGRGLVKKFTSPAIFCFHTVNAWETANSADCVDITCELSEYDNMDILHWFYYENMVSDECRAGGFDTKRKGMTGGIARYKLASVPLTGTSKIKATAEKIGRVDFPDAGDLPRIHPSYALRQHRYVWAVTDRHRSSFVDGLVKTDMTEGTAVFWEAPRQTPGEPIFVPKPDGNAEDDGVLLTVVLDGDRGESYVLCLDAATMKELGRAEVGHPVGFGFHGQFVGSN